MKIIKHKIYFNDRLDLDGQLFTNKIIYFKIKIPFIMKSYKLVRYSIYLSH